MENLDVKSLYDPGAITTKINNTCLEKLNKKPNTKKINTLRLWFSLWQTVFSMPSQDHNLRITQHLDKINNILVNKDEDKLNLSSLRQTVLSQTAQTNV